MEEVAGFVREEVKMSIKVIILLSLVAVAACSPTIFPIIPLPGRLSIGGDLSVGGHTGLIGGLVKGIFGTISGVTNLALNSLNAVLGLTIGTINDVFSLIVHLSLVLQVTLNNLIGGLGFLFVRLVACIIKIAVCFLGLPGDRSICANGWNAKFGINGEASNANDLIILYKLNNAQSELDSYIRSFTGGKGLGSTKGSAKIVLERTNTLCGYITNYRQISKQTVTDTFLILTTVTGSISNSREKDSGRQIINKIIPSCGSAFRQQGYPDITIQINNILNIVGNANNDKVNWNGGNAGSVGGSVGGSTGISVGAGTGLLGGIVNGIFGTISGVVNLALGALENVLNIKIAALNDVFSLIVNLGLVLQVTLNNLISGFGSLFIRLVACVIKIAVCFLGLPGDKGICAKGWNANVGISGEASNAADLIVLYKLTNAKKDLDDYINSYTNGKGIGSTTGSVQIAFQKSSTLVGFITNYRSITRQTVTDTFIILTTISGSIGNSRLPNSGKEIVNKIVPECGKYFKQQGYPDITIQITTITNECGKANGDNVNWDGNNGGSTGGNNSGNTGGNTGGDDKGNTGGNNGGDNSGNTGGNTGGDDKGNTGGNTGGSTGGDDKGNTGGNTGGDDKGNTGGNNGGDNSGNTGGSTGGDDKGNTGGDNSGNTGGSTGGDDKGNTGGNTGGDDKGNTGGDNSGNTGGSTGGDDKDNTGGNTGGDDKGNTGGDNSGNTGGSTGGDDKGNTGGNTGGDNSGNTGGSTGGDDKGNTGGNTGSDDKGNTGGSTGGNTGGSTGGSTGGGNTDVGKIIGDVIKVIPGVTSISLDIISQIIQFKINTFVDVINLLAKLTIALGGIIDSIISGLGSIIIRLVAVIFKVGYCVNGFGSDKSICTKEWNAQWGITGEATSAVDLYALFRVTNCKTDVSNIVSTYTNGKGIDSTTGFVKIILQIATDLSNTVSSGSITKDSFSSVVLNVFNIFGSITNSYKQGSGTVIIKRVLPICSAVFVKQGFPEIKVDNVVSTVNVANNDKFNWSVVKNGGDSNSDKLTTTVKKVFKGVDTQSTPSLTAVLNLQPPRNFDDVCSFGVQVVQGLGGILDIAIKGLGSLLARIVGALINYIVAILGAARNAKSFVSQKAYYESFGVTVTGKTWADISAGFKITTAKADLDAILRVYTNNGGLKSLAGVKLAIFNAAYSLVDIVSKGQGIVEADLTTVFRVVTTLIGGFANSITVDVGKTIVDNMLPTVSFYLERNGYPSLGKDSNSIYTTIATCNNSDAPWTKTSSATVTEN